MNPAFATVNIRELTPLFYKVAHRVCIVWTPETYSDLRLLETADR